MKDINRVLEKEKERLMEVKAPDNLEDRLRKSLEGVEKRKTKGLRLKIASMIIIIFFLGYNIDSLAHYGKRLMGYENIMNGSLKELNELGKGQVINKSHTFKGGEKISIDSLMLDENNMIIFYSLFDKKGRVADFEGNIHISLETARHKWLTYGGVGEISEDGKTMRWVITTNEVPKFYQKTFRLRASLNRPNQGPEEANITFKIDRKQALGKSIAIKINKKLELGDRSIKVKNLIASPTVTRIDGQIQNILELGIDHIKGERLLAGDIEMELLVDGKVVPSQGGGISTNMKGTNFHLTYDALPKEMKNLKLNLKIFSAGYDVKTREVLTRVENQEFEILEQKILIKNIYEKNGETFIDIATEDSVRLTNLYLNIDGRDTPLAETIGGEIEKILVEDGARIINNRTLKFKGIGKNLTLGVNRIRFSKSYDKLIYEYNFL